MAVKLPSFADYPTTATTVETDWGVVDDLSGDGVLYQRGLYATEYYRLALEWGPLSRERYQDLVKFFARHRQSEIEFSLDGETYRGRLMGPVSTRWISGVTSFIRATLRGQKITNPLAAIVAAYTQASVWYDPSDLAAMWQDTAGTVPAVVGMPVARIDDKGNLGLHATQSTAGNRPTLQRDSGGNYCLQFAEEDFLTIPTGMPHPTVGAALILSWTHTSYPQSVGSIYRQRGDSVDANHRHPKVAVSDAGSVIVNYGNQSIQSIATSTPTNERHVLSATIEADNVQIRSRLNGALFGADSGTGFGDDGDSPTGQIGGGLAGLLYGVVHIQGAISDADRKTAEAYFGV